jgi:hypothetical protein
MKDERKWLVVHVRGLSWNSSAESEEESQDLSQYMQYLVRHSNRLPPECKSRTLTSLLCLLLLVYKFQVSAFLNE